VFVGCDAQFPGFFEDVAFPGQFRNGNDTEVAYLFRWDMLVGAGILSDGGYVDATFVGKTVTDALMVPTVAIATEAGQLGVQIADDEGNPTFRPVTVGLTQDSRTQILSGLAAGDRIFLDLPQEKLPVALP
jgi:HlyD family secretion protein